jgi:hypothetical protein
MGCESSKQKERCDTKWKLKPYNWCNYSDNCKNYRCDIGLDPHHHDWCKQRTKLIASEKMKSLYARQAEAARAQAEAARAQAEAARAQAEEAQQKSETAEADRKLAREEQEKYRQILLKKTNKEADRKKKAQDAADLARRQLDAIRFKSKRLRELNACNQDDIDALKVQHLILAEEIELEEARAAAQAELILAEEREAKAKEELRLKEETMAKRINFSQTAKMGVSFTPKPKPETPVLPVRIEGFTNPEKLIDSADESINNIYTNHYEHNLKTYIQNKIVIDDMTDKINNINSRLQYKMNKNINYGPDGQLTFY